MIEKKDCRLKCAEIHALALLRSNAIGIAARWFDQFNRCSENLMLVNCCSGRFGQGDCCFCHCS